MQPYETLHIFNIDPIWMYLDHHMPVLLEDHFFDQERKEDYSAMIIEEVFIEYVRTLTGRYYRPRISPMFEETLYSFYHRVCGDLMSTMDKLFKDSGIRLDGAIRRIDYMTTRSGMVVCVSRTFKS